MKQKLLKLMCLLCVGMMGMSAWGADVTEEASSFTSTSGSINENITYAAAKANGTTNPVINNQNIRIYRNNSSTAALGGTLTVTANNKVILKSVTFTLKTSLGYSVSYNNGTATTGTNNTITVSDEEGITTAVLQNNSKEQMDITKISVTYAIAKDDLKTATMEFSAANVTGNVTTGEFVAPSLTYTGDGTIRYSSSNTSVATVNESTGVVTLISKGNTTITATAPMTDEYMKATASYVLNVVDNYVHDAFTITTTGVTASSYTLFSNKKVNNGSNAIYGGTVAKNSQGCLQLNGANHPVVTTTTGGIVRSIAVTWSQKQKNTNNRVLYIYGKTTPYAANAGSASGTKIGEITFKDGDLSGSTFVSGAYPYIYIYSSGAMYMDEIDIAWEDAYTRNVTNGNYGTICLPFSVDLTKSTGATYYTVAGVTKNGDAINGISLAEVTGNTLVAGTPYIFKATADKLVATYSTNYVTTPVAATGLVGNLGTAATINAGEYIYILGTDNKMHKLSGTATATVATNRAYLNLEGVAEAPASVKGVRLYFDGSEEATAITEITEKTEGTEGTIYNLQGQRVNSLQRGIYIVGGKKVLVK